MSSKEPFCKEEAQSEVLCLHWTDDASQSPPYKYIVGLVLTKGTCLGPLIPAVLPTQAKPDLAEEVVQEQFQRNPGEEQIRYESDQTLTDLSVRKQKTTLLVMATTCICVTL